MPHDDDILRCHAHHGVLELRLNRPARLNAMTHGMAQALLQAIEQAQRDEQVRVLLITAEGRAFCAGKDRDDPPTSAFVDALQQLAAAMLRSPKPFIAGVNGWAVGAGFELALGCDLILASRDARFKLPEAQLGLPATGGVHMLLPRLVGMGRAKGLLWLGQELSAERAHQWGLAWELLEPADLPARARALAAELAALPPATLARVKRLVHDSQLPDIDQALRDEGAAAG